MRIPAIRAKIGSWVYYISVLSFEHVSLYIEKIDDQLHQSEGLRDLIQRSITKNYLKIKDYILNQPELFFNSLVLGVYDGSPRWIEVELNYEHEEFFNLGLLEFPNGQKIFPIDGQHRVEGIKAAIKENPSLKNNKVGAIFVGHSKDLAGMQKSRRLFTTLNRYAKPVTMDDIIALDEDDSVAIITRNLLENYKLFTGKRVTKSKNKAIQDKDKDALTSIITLYQCNRDLLKVFRKRRKEEAPNASRDKLSIEEYLKFRPSETEITKFEEFVVNFWDAFCANLNTISTFLNNTNENPALTFRNKDNGGNVLFRPVGLLPFIQAAIEIHKRTKEDFFNIFQRFNRANLNLNEIPWKNILWNPTEKTMIMGNVGIVKLLFIYIYNKDLLIEKETSSLRIKYADKLNFEGRIEDVLNHIPVILRRTKFNS